MKCLPAIQVDYIVYRETSQPVKKTVTIEYYKIIVKMSPLQSIVVICLKGLSPDRSMPQWESNLVADAITNMYSCNMTHLPTFVYI
jgi:hypothetical protein